MYLKTKRILFLSRPHPATNKSVGRRNSSKNINQQPNSTICYILGEGRASISNSDASTPTSWEVDMIKTGTSSHNKPQTRQKIEKLGGNRRGANSDESPDGASMTGKEVVVWLRRVVRVQEVEVRK